MSDRETDLLTIDAGFQMDNNAERKSSTNSNLDPLPSTADFSYTFVGSKNRLGKPDGHCTLYFVNGRRFIGGFRHGLREGEGTLYDRDGTRMLQGTYKEDKLNGIAHIMSSSDGSLLEVMFVNGVPSGLARKFSSKGHLSWIGRYDRGSVIGICWKSGDGKGWTCGSSDGLGRIHGNNAIYLYPDFHSALQGEWSQDIMKRAKFCKVMGFHIIDGFPLPHAVPTEDEFLYRFDQSTFDKISSHPLHRDPYEASCVECQNSKVPNSGQGVFAKRNLAANQVVAFYNGVRFNDCHAFNDWDNNSYKIRLSEKKKQILDIPLQSRTLDLYSATLAHKINHSFTPNAKFIDFLHPRFGRIVAVKTVSYVPAGAELFCHYGYNPSDSPRWYRLLYNSLCQNGEKSETNNKL